MSLLESSQAFDAEIRARTHALEKLRDSLKKRLTECKRLNSALGKGMGKPSSGPGFFHNVTLWWASGSPPSWWSGL